MYVTILFFTCIASIRIISAILNVNVEPREKTVLEGENLTAMCSVNRSISYCHWKKANAYKLVDGENIKYKQNFKNGECGITISNITEKHNGVLRCVLIADNRTVYGDLNLVVAKIPKAPQLNIIVAYPLGQENRTKIFIENEVIKADCSIEFVRPPPNISWFIGNDLITNSTGPAQIFDLGSEYVGLKRIQQTFGKYLKFSDNGKDLKCVIHHIALRPEDINQATYKLRVYFKPKFENTGKTAFTIGETGKVVVTIQANPEPTIQWLVDGDEILEGNCDATQRYHAASLIHKEQDIWDTVLYIDKVTPEDIEKTLILTASNKLGKEQYNVTASLVPFKNVTISFPPCDEATNAAEATTAVVAKAIAGIAIVILLSILLIYLVLNRLHSGTYIVQSDIMEEDKREEQTEFEKEMNTTIWRSVKNLEVCNTY